MQRILNHAAIQTGVNIGAWPRHTYFGADDAAPGVSELRFIGLEVAVAVEQQVGLQAFFIGVDEGFNAGRAGFFLTLKHDLHVYGQCTIGSQQRFKGLQVAPDTGFVIAGAAREHIAIAITPSKGSESQSGNGSTGCTS